MMVEGSRGRRFELGRKARKIRAASRTEASVVTMEEKQLFKRSLMVETSLVDVIGGCGGDVEGASR